MYVLLLLICCLHHIWNWTAKANIDNVGISGCCWSPSVILRALKAENKPFTFKKVPRHLWAKALILEQKRSFLVEGILNVSYVGRIEKQHKDVTISQRWCNSSAWGTCWRHSTAVINGRVHDNTWVHEETTGYQRTMSTEYLWINPQTGKPDSKKGFFKDIYHVYEFSFNNSANQPMLN